MFQKSFKELKDAGNFRVFAVADGNVASNMVDLNGVGVAQGLADQAYIYTDRPAYRPGQLVHIRGVLRKAADDGYTIEKDKKYTVEVFDRRTCAVWQNEAKLSEYGSFHTNFLLPPTGGAWQLSYRCARRRQPQLRRHVHGSRISTGTGEAVGRHRSQSILSRRGDRGQNQREVLLWPPWWGAKSAINWPAIGCSPPRPTKREK